MSGCDEVSDAGANVDINQLFKLTGECQCKDGFGGRDCSTCENGYWGDANIGDCKSCNCNPDGTVYGENMCEPYSGQCHCQPGIR